MTQVELEVNGTSYTFDVEPRLLLADLLRDHLQLTGTHIGCEHGVCGTCTVQIDGKPARSCLTLAVSVSGSTIRTVEGLAPDGALDPLQTAFHEHHALQCGYCTPGFLMSIDSLAPELRGLDDTELREQLAGNLCRCTGYQNIVEATREAVSEQRIRRINLQRELPSPDDPDRAWDALGDPGPLLVELGLAGVVELLDLDDDRRVANFEIRGRRSSSHVRGTARITLEPSAIALRIELECLGDEPSLDQETLESRVAEAHARLVNR